MTEAVEKKLKEVGDQIAPGDWTIDEYGVRRERAVYKKGKLIDSYTETASPIPVLPTAILENMDTHTEKLELSFFKHKGWRTLVTERSVTANRNSIIKLADKGLEVNSDNAGVLVKYIADVVAGSLFCLPHKPAKSVMGWVDDEFMPYTDKITFDGDDQFKHLYKAISTKGKLKDWVEFVRPLRSSLDLRLCMATSFASPLVELIGENPFVFHMWGGTGSGKAQPLHTKIITPYGHTTMGAISVGDEVMGGDGLPHKVIGVYPQGKKDVYEVTFSDGRKTRCCKEHLWSVTTRTRRNHGRGYTTMSLDEMLKAPIKGSKGFTYRVPLCKPVEYQPSAPLPVSPYLLGALIGDGCLTLTRNQSNRGRTLYFNNSEHDVIGRVTNELNRIGAKMRFNPSTANQFAISNCDGLKDSIVALGLNVKSKMRFIPEIYKRAAIADRRLLLAGLIDTDGSVSEGGAISYSTQSEQLACDVRELAHGLGYRAASSVDRRGGFTVSIASDGDVFLSKKHTNRMDAAKMRRRRSEDTESLAITSVELVGAEECQCIMVDSAEHTYLCDDHIVTHNTVAAMVAMSVWGDPAMGKLTRTMNITSNAMLSTAAFLRNLPFAGDELQTIKSRWTNYDNLIMCITEGVDRGRMSYDKINETRSWKCSFIFTGEEPCIKQASGGGAKNRVIEVECKDKVVADGNLVANFVRTHFGSAGEPYIEQIKQEDVGEQYREVFTQILSETDTTDKQAGSMAMMLVADSIASRLFWPDEQPITIAQIQKYLCSASEVDVTVRAYQFVRNSIAENSANFYSDGRQNWGSIEGDYAYINKNVLCRIMEDVGFDFDAVKGKWSEMGCLEKNVQGRYLHYKSINSVQAYYVKLALNAYDDFEEVV